jgi:hypothetical protein
LGAGGPGGVEEIDGVDTVAAAALGEIQDIVVNGQGVEVGVLADLVGRVAELGDVEAADRGGRAGGL